MAGWDLHLIWFLLMGFFFTAYAVLDGYDLGIGFLHLTARSDEDRHLILSSIGPYWDANEVWLIVAGGSLFAAFPAVYATVFSGFYLAFILLLMALIFRAVSIENRNQLKHPVWRNTWDFVFGAASMTAALLLGIAFGNMIWGIPLNKQGEYAGGFLNLLHPYSLLAGFLVLVLFTMHGALYLATKTEGALQEKMARMAKRAYFIFLVLFLAVTSATFLFIPRMIAPFLHDARLWVLPVLNGFVIFWIFLDLSRKKYTRAFFFSCSAVFLLMGHYALGSFPYLVYSNPSPEFSLTVYTSASSPKTLSVMLVISLIGVPLMLIYTAFIHWVFRGKTRLESSGY